MKEHDLYKKVTGEMIVDVKDIEQKYAQELGQNLLKRGTLKHSRKTLIAWGAVAACLLIMCVPVAAKGIGKLWDSLVADMYGADEAIQKQYENTDLSQTFDGEEDQDAVVSATQGGVTVTLQQTVADNYGMAIYLNVKTDGSVPLTDTNVFDTMLLSVDGKSEGVFEGISAGFVMDRYAVSEYERSYEFFCNNSKAVDLRGKHMVLKLTDLLADQGKQDFITAVEGTWELSWDVTGQYAGEIKEINLNKDQVGDFTLEKLELSPISYTLKYQYKGNDWDELETPRITFIMKNGTVYDDPTDTSGEGEWITGGGGGMGTEQSHEMFVQVLDLENLETIRISLGGEVKEYQIK